ncbi:DEAD/DEAH box helicase family protein [Tautonia plasticadhaerens]|uniref:Type-1 restriction enzyme R protein n=1 Tax=Tautonia plasticadhaerens TaxID=2527974 RepID=A0A518GZS8_9BACT|nr:DEAD/DEAH box helicase family protein [Tautonia plasticadhaerens]QDV34095.1 Type-1 restriction enzyme R protein [Tautonia plasticadhaerens]
MGRSEVETRTKLIDPALHARGWTEDLIRREETAGTIEIIDGRPRRRAKGRVDYTLRVKVAPDAQPVAVGLLEAKAEDLPPTHGLEQAKCYAMSKRLNVPFVFASNGHLFVEFDRFTGLTSAPRPLTAFPGPGELQARYEQGMGFRLDDDAAKPLVTPYKTGEGFRRYYQDAAIRAVMETIAKGENRALLTLATGAGKTFIAVNLLRRIADAGQLRRALFVCDRDELRTQATAAFRAVFGADAAPVAGGEPQKNARILIATYQTLDLASDEADANFLTAHYPEDYFSHIVIDECHRSAWGKWSEVLRRNPSAVQVGLTATPREIELTERSREAITDERISADNIRHFGEPVYEYDVGQGIDDGYLAACEIIRRDIFLGDKPSNERESGLDRPDLAGKVIRDAVTGRQLSEAETRDRYSAADFEAALLLPDRVEAMARDLFAHLLTTGGPEQKTIIFCARDRHADAVAIALNNLYAEWCQREGRARADPYAFKCTAASGGADYLADLKGAARHHFIATTVDLLTTGVDVPPVRNIVFFKYVRSPIAFHQMVGRGTRIDIPSGKLMFRVYDYTNATRLFGAEFLTRFIPAREPSEPPTPPDGPGEPIIEVEGFDVRINEAGRSILARMDGKTILLSIEAYKDRLAAKLVEEAPTLDAFRSTWIDRTTRAALLSRLPDEGRSASVVRSLEQMGDFDLFDVLAELGYGQAPRTRAERADAFSYKHDEWLRGLPADVAATIRALASQFARAGTDGLENPHVFQTPEVMQAGGLNALKSAGQPAEMLRETKTRMFTV